MTDTSKTELADFSKATPRPWAAATRQGSWDWVVYQSSKPNIEVCQVFHDDTELNETGEAVAALIVEAVNSYDETREQLSSAKAEIERLREQLAFSGEQAEKLEMLVEPHVAWDGQPSVIERLQTALETIRKQTQKRDDLRDVLNFGLLANVEEIAAEALSNTTPSPDPKDAVIAELVGALEDMLFLAEAEHVCLLSWNQTGSAANYDGITRKAKSALSHAKQGGSDG